MATVSPVDDSRGARSTLSRSRVARSRVAGGSLAIQACGIALAVVVWELLSLRFGGFLVPSPRATARNIYTNFTSDSYLVGLGITGGYFHQLLFTARNAILGVAIGTVIGASIGLASAPFRVIAEIANPIVAFFGSAPIFVAAPFFLIWFGVVPIAPLIIVAAYSALLIYIFARRAADNLPPQYIESSLCLGASRGFAFRRVFVPGSIPELLGGVRIALAGAWGLEALGELLGVQKGIGFLIRFFADQFSVPNMFALVALLGATAIVFDWFLVLGGHYVIRWSATGRRLGL